jgi:hypothetical protein
MPEYANYFVYFGTRTSQPLRARAFIDLAVRRLSDNPDYVLGAEHLRSKHGIAMHNGQEPTLAGSAGAA